jgi:hypothetical protein
MNTVKHLDNHNEQGSARLKLIIFLVIFAIVIYAGYVYVPVSLDSYYFKDAMQNTVNMAVAQGRDGNWVRDQLAKTATEYNVPPDAVITPAQKEGRLEVRVQYTRPISFPGYTYNYEFDHTTKSTGFLTR